VVGRSEEELEALRVARRGPHAAIHVAATEKARAGRTSPPHVSRLAPRASRPRAGERSSPGRPPSVRG
jgi:hypothetical protein